MVRSMSPSPVGAVRVSGLRVAGHALDLDTKGNLLAAHTDAAIRMI